MPGDVDVVSKARYIPARRKYKPSRNFHTNKFLAPLSPSDIATRATREGLSPFILLSVESNFVDQALSV